MTVPRPASEHAREPGQDPREALILNALYLEVDSDAVERAEVALCEILRERNSLASALAVVEQERDEYREALERIALGITGRRADFREGEHGRYGPLTDWQLARGALAVPSSGEQT